jgi:phenylpropionate dioxygenase-like ring-hydroxylating dioxygenase large terminal subunit
MTAQGLVPRRALAARYYKDPLIFRDEQEKLFSKTWLFAGHASQVASAGDYFAFQVAGQNLFCIRDRDGKIRCFHNVCQHRAHEIVQGTGKVRVLVCPYHAWSYELDGRLRAAPNAKTTPGFSKDEICLTEVRLENFCGFLFVNLDDRARPMAEWFPNVEAELRDFVPDIDTLAPLTWVEVEEACNWKVSVENYSECYHCALNHPTFAKGVIRPETYDIRAQGYCLRHTTECANLEAMSYPIDLSANARAGDYSSWFLWPGFSFQVYPGNRLNSYHWRPLDHERVLVVRGWYSHRGAEDPVVRRLAKQDLETTVAEDIRLVESVQRGLASKGYKPGPLVLDPDFGVNSEHSVAALHDWTLAALEG